MPKLVCSEHDDNLKFVFVEAINLQLTRSPEIDYVFLYYQKL